MRSMLSLFIIHRFQLSRVKDFILMRHRCIHITFIQDSVLLSWIKNRPQSAASDSDRATSKNVGDFNDRPYFGRCACTCNPPMRRKECAIVSRYIRSSRCYNSRFRWTIRLRRIPRAIPRDLQWRYYWGLNSIERRFNISPSRKPARVKC